MKVYTLFDSEDEGHRFPLVSKAFGSIKNAMNKIKSVTGEPAIAIDYSNDNVVGCFCPPNTVGEVIGIFPHENTAEWVKSKMDQLPVEEWDETLYAGDYIFLVEIEVDA